MENPERADNNREKKKKTAVIIPKCLAIQDLLEYYIVSPRKLHPG